MKQFISVKDAGNPHDLIQEALDVKKAPHAFADLGRNKTLGLLFFNASLRTRLSTQKAAMNLGMRVIVMNIGNEGWALEYEDGTIMNGSTVEHVKDAASVIGLYCDIVGIRCFPTLLNKADDYSEKVLHQFIRYCPAPLLSMESATRHPLQSLADMMTIQEFKRNKHPKIVLTWAPHIKPLPQVVANSFSEWALTSGYDLTITHPEGFELCEDFTRGAVIEHVQQKALENADFVYVKNWSSYADYGTTGPAGNEWLLNHEKLSITHAAKIMHCLPVRRNLELPDHLLDGQDSLILKQAENRIYAAQAVLKRMLETNF